MPDDDEKKKEARASTLSGRIISKVPFPGSDSLRSKVQFPDKIKTRGSGPILKSPVASLTGNPMRRLSRGVVKPMIDDIKSLTRPKQQLLERGADIDEDIREDDSMSEDDSSSLDDNDVSLPSDPSEEIVADTYEQWRESLVFEQQDSESTLCIERLESFVNGYLTVVSDEDTMDLDDDKVIMKNELLEMHKAEKAVTRSPARNSATPLRNISFGPSYRSPMGAWQENLKDDKIHPIRDRIRPSISIRSLSRPNLGDRTDSVPTIRENGVDLADEAEEVNEKKVNERTKASLMTMADTDKSGEPLTMEKMEEMEKLAFELLEEKDSANALRMFSLTIEAKKKFLEEGHLELALDKTYHGRGDAYYQNGDLDGAIDSYKDALRLRQMKVIRFKRKSEKYKECIVLASKTLASLTLVLEEKKDYDSLLEYLLEWMNNSAKEVGPKHKKTVDLMEKVGETYLLQGDTKRALIYLHKVLEQKRRLLGFDLEISNTLSLIGHAQYRKGELRGAMVAFKEVLNIRLRVLKSDILIAHAYSDIGHVHLSMGNNKEALMFYHKALDLKNDQLQPDDLSIAESYRDIGACLEDEEKFSHSMQWYKKSFSIYRKTGHDKSEDTAHLLFAMGKVHQELNEHDEARRSFQDCGNIHYDLKNFPEALKAYLSFFNVKTLLFSETHIYLASKTHCISQWLTWKGQKDVAKRTMDDVLRIQRIVHGEDNLEVASTLEDIGNILFYHNKDYEQALEKYVEVMRIQNLIQKTKTGGFMNLHGKLASCYQHMGSLDESLREFVLQMDAKKKHFGVDHISVAATLRNIALVYKEKKEYLLAMDYLQKALTINQAHLPNHPALAVVKSDLADVYSHQHVYEKAVEFYQSSLQILEMPSHEKKYMPQISNLYFKLGTAFYDSCQYDNAVASYDDCKRIGLEAGCIDEDYSTRISYCLGEIYLKQGKLDDAIVKFSTSLGIRKAQYARSRKINKPRRRPKPGEIIKTSKALLKALENVTATLSSMSLVYKAQGDYKQATNTLEEARQMANALPGAELIEAEVLKDIGYMYMTSGIYIDAIRSFESCLELRKNVSGSYSSEDAQIMTEMGYIHLVNADLGQALECYINSLNTKMDTLGSNHIDTISSHIDIGKVHRRMKEHKKAMASFYEAFRISNLHIGDNDEQLAYILFQIASLHEELEEYHQAVEVYTNSAIIHQNNNHVKRALEAFCKALCIKDDSQAIRSAQHQVANKLLFFGKILHWRGDNINAITAFSKSLAPLKATLGKDHEDIISATEIMASIHESLDHFSDAIAAFKEVLRVNRIRLGGESTAILPLLVKIAKLYEREGNREKAIENYKEILHIKQAHFGFNHISFAATSKNIGTCYRLQEKHDIALRYLKGALRTFRKELGEDHVSVATVLEEIVEIHNANNNNEGAIRNYEDILRMKIRSLGTGHLGVADCYFNLGKAQLKVGEYEDGIESCLASLQIRIELGKDDDIFTATIFHTLGDAYHKQEILDEAMAAFNKALDLRNMRLDILTNNDDDDDDNGSKIDEAIKEIAATLSEIGIVWEEENNYKNALEAHTQALRVRNKAKTKDIDSINFLVTRIGDMYFKTEDYQKAIYSYEEALKYRRQKVKQSHKDHKESTKVIDGVLYRTDQYAGAIKSVKASQTDIAEILNKIGLSYQEMKRYDEAMDAFQEAILTLKNVHGEFCVSVAPGIEAIAQLYYVSGRYDDAMNSFHEALQLKKVNLGDDHIQVANCLENIGKIQTDQGNYDAAIDTFQDVIKIKSIHLPQDHPSLAHTFYLKGNALHRLKRLEESVADFQKARTIYQGKLDEKKVALVDSFRKAAGVTYKSIKSFEIEAEIPALSEKVANSMKVIGDVLKEQGLEREASDVLTQALEYTAN